VEGAQATSCMASGRFRPQRPLCRSLPPPWVERQSRTGSGPLTMAIGIAIQLRGHAYCRFRPIARHGHVLVLVRGAVRADGCGTCESRRFGPGNGAATSSKVLFLPQARFTESHEPGRARLMPPKSI
jgi:hypothetical protein